MSQPENRDHGAESPAPARRLSPWWAIVPPVSFGTLAWLPFLYAWWRTRRRSYLTAALAYGAVLGIGGLLGSRIGRAHPPAGETILGLFVLLILTVGGFLHVLKIRSGYGRQLDAMSAAARLATVQRDTDLAPNLGGKGRRRTGRVRGRVGGAVDFVYGALALTFFIVGVSVTLHGQASALGLVLVVLSAIIGVRLLRRSRRQFVVAHEFDARSATAEMTRDPRPPVLYLRSFKHDPSAAHRGLLSSRSEEEQMAAVLHRLGPVVAIGTPGEAVQTLGAARDYVRDEEWQEWVTRVMEHAGLVLLRASDTESFLWETVTTASRLAPEKWAVLLPRDPELYAHFCSRVDRHLPGPLPSELPRVNAAFTRGPMATDVWGLLYFDADGKSVLRRLGQGGVWPMLIWLGFWQPYRACFENLFRPVLRRAGVRALPLPLMFESAVSRPQMLLLRHRATAAR